MCGVDSTWLRHAVRFYCTYTRRGYSVISGFRVTIKIPNGELIEINTRDGQLWQASAPLWVRKRLGYSLMAASLAYECVMKKSKMNKFAREVFVDVLLADGVSKPVAYALAAFIIINEWRSK